HPRLMAEWTVKHRDHKGRFLDSFKPENLHFQLNLNQPDTIDYELSLQDAYEGFVGPYRTDWELWRDDRYISGGLHTGVAGGVGDEHVKIAGKSWLHYLERRQWPFSLSPNLAQQWPTGIIYVAANKRVSQIVHDLVRTIRDFNAFRWPNAPNGTNPSYSLGYAIQTDTVPKKINYQIDPLDTED